MQPNSEPTPTDVAAVQAHLSGSPAPTPQPAPQPAQMQPEAPTPQPAPTQQTSDPFASLFASEPEPTQPTQPTEPAQPTQQPAEPAPTQPTEVAQPTQPQEPAPQQTFQPAAPAIDRSQPQDDYQSYDDYMKQVMAGVPEAPNSPDPEKVNPDDPAAIKGFFDELVNTAVTRAQAETARKSAIQTSEKRLWDAAMDKYGTLKTNKQLRDTVHAVRMGYFNRGIALTPTQAAEKLLEGLGSQYRQGMADSQVVTTYEQVQPAGGGSAAPVATSLDKENALTSVQSGGETALAEILDQEIKAGRL